jgi:hypothetical protein
MLFLLANVAKGRKTLTKFETIVVKKNCSASSQFLNRKAQNLPLSADRY